MSALDEYVVQLPEGGVIPLQSTEEVDRWQTLSQRYQAEYGLKKVNDQTNLTTLLVQHISLYRSQQALSGRVPELDDDELPTGRYTMRVLKPAEIRAYQDALNTSSKEIREIEKNMGIDKKAQPIYELVLTPAGWREIGELHEGAMVIGSDGRPTRVEAVHDYPDGDVWEIIFTDGSSVECDIDHLWPVSTDATEERVLSLREILPTIRPGKHHGGSRRPWRVRRAPLIHFESTAELSIDPYLLGALLGDGGLTRPSTVTFHAWEQDVLEAVEDALPSGMRLSGPVGSKRIVNAKRGGGNPLVRALVNLGLHGHGSGTKFIPETYLRAAPAVRLALLAGLMDTDGHVSRRGGGACYATTSDRLADDVQFLVNSLGLRCGRSRLRTHSSFGDGCGWYLTFRLPADIPMAHARRSTAIRLSRCNREYLSIAKVVHRPRCPVRCITVKAADGLYVTRGFAITHNSREQAGDETLRGWRTAMKARAHEYGLHISRRVKAYEEFAMELRWRVRLNEVGDAEDKHYEDCSDEGIIKWAREELARLEKVDKDFAQETALVMGRARP